MMKPMTSALLAVQNALLGVPTPQLRAVVIDLNEDRGVFSISFFYDGEASEELLDLWSCAATEASCDLPMKFNMVDDNYIRVDSPQELPIEGRLAYLRKE